MENRIAPDANRGTLLLSRSDVTGLLDLHDCIAAVEDAFRMHATGKAGQPGVLGLMARGDVHAELGQIAAGAKRGRARDDEIIVSIPRAPRCRTSLRRPRFTGRRSRNSRANDFHSMHNSIRRSTCATN